VSDLLSVVMVRVTLHEVSPNAMAIAVATANARYSFEPTLSTHIFVKECRNEGISLILFLRKKGAGG
jgi:hypothetical protein